MTRIRAIARITAIFSLFAVVPPLPSAAQQLVFESFPVSALVRGENVWLRLDPAADTEVITLLQRGDPITITGESAFDGDEEYYPVESDLTGETGWVGALFIDPRSIAGASSVVVPLDEVDALPEDDVAVDEPADQRQQDREARRAARQAEQDQTQAPAAETEEPADDQAARRAARQAERAAATAETEQPADDQAARRAARQAERDANADGANATADALTFSGNEPTVTPEFTAPADQLIITGNFEGEQNFTVIAVTPEGVEDMLFDERGPFSGETTYETTAGSALYLNVDADGPWDLIVEPAS